MTKEEFNDLVVVYRPRLVKSAINKWGNDGEDAIQEAFLRAYASCESFKSECTFSSWIFGIAKNVLLNWRKADKLDIVDVDVFDLPDSDDTFQSTYAQQWLESLSRAELKSVLDDVGKTSKHRARRKYED